MRLWLTLQTIWVNKSIVNSLHFIGLMPKGMKEVRGGAGMSEAEWHCGVLA